MYRAAANLKLAHKEILRGQAFSRRDMAAPIVERLMASGKVETVSAPPLSEIPVIAGYAKALEPLGIEMCDAFVDAVPGDLSGALEMDVERVRALQEAVCRTLDAPQPKGG